MDIITTMQPKSFGNKNMFENSEQILEKNAENTKQIEENLKKYQNMSQNELMSELFKEADKIRNRGGLDNNSLNVLRSTLAPMLSTEQNELLNNILNKLK